MGGTGSDSFLSALAWIGPKSMTFSLCVKEKPPNASPAILSDHDEQWGRRSHRLASSTTRRPWGFSCSSANARPPRRAARERSRRARATTLFPAATGRVGSTVTRSSTARRPPEGRSPNPCTAPDTSGKMGRSAARCDCSHVCSMRGARRRGAAGPGPAGQRLMPLLSSNPWYCSPLESWVRWQRPSEGSRWGTAPPGRPLSGALVTPLMILWGQSMRKTAMWALLTGVSSRRLPGAWDQSTRGARGPVPPTNEEQRSPQRWHPRMLAMMRRANVWSKARGIHSAIESIQYFTFGKAFRATGCISSISRAGYPMTPSQGRTGNLPEVHVSRRNRGATSSGLIPLPDAAAIRAGGPHMGSHEQLRNVFARRALRMWPAMTS